MIALRVHSRRWLASAALLTGLLTAEEAHAWSFKDRFVEPAVWGGAGNRFFTGSPIDGYGCNVCHQGGAEPKVEVLGLPEGYAPGRLYDIEVVFQNVDPKVRHALHLEFVGRDGKAAGTLRLIDPRQVDARARCDQKPEEPPADYELPEDRQATDPRHILGVAYCGASHMRFRFGPPNTPDVSFSMSVVAADRDGTVNGDGVLNVQKVLRRAGEPAPQSEGCALAAPGSGSSLAAQLSGLMVAAAAVLLMRRRTRR